MTEPVAATGRRRPGSIVFGVVVGLLVAWWSYDWITDTERRDIRQREENAVLAVRGLVAAKVGNDALEIVDPLSPDRDVGKVYIYSAGNGYEVSGFYRRHADDRWHEFLASIGADLALTELKVRDAALADRARSDAALTVVE